MLADLSLKYTVIPIHDPDHQRKIHDYLQAQSKGVKASYCRFYLRGLCIMQSQYCKFAHDFQELVLNITTQEQSSTDDAKRKREKPFNQCMDFHQRPLFVIKALPYTWLFRYQNTPRFQKSGLETLSLKEISDNRPARHKIREIMHREQWDQFLDFFENKFKVGDYPISLMSSWFAQLGFEKATTSCRFGDFMRYLTYVRKYVEVNIVMPPRLLRAIFYVHNPNTLVSENLDQILREQNRFREQQRQLKEAKLKQLPLALRKRFICRYEMAGNCQKLSEQCSYAHRVADWQFSLEQQFLKQHRQPVKSKEDRLNYVSLHRYSRQISTEEVSLEQINSNSNLKLKIRKTLHHQLYRGFLQLLHQATGKPILELAFVHKMYKQAGFNHTDQNKFGQLEAALPQLGYHVQELLNNGGKTVYIYRIPPIEELDLLYNELLRRVLEENIATKDQEQDELMLQSTLRRLIYTMHRPFTIPFHLYLKLKNMTLRAVIQGMFPEWASKVFFQGSEQNYRKLVDCVRKYFKREKKNMYRFEDVQQDIKISHKDKLNLNLLPNLHTLLQLAALECSKRLFSWPFASKCIIMDPSHKPTAELPAQQQAQHTDIYQQFPHFATVDIVIVDSKIALEFAHAFLITSGTFGVDLEGQLKVGGYIDLVQVSARRKSYLEKKIFIFDIFVLKKIPELFEATRKLLQIVFQDSSRTKILHDCRQDSIALKSLMKIRLQNVFDTSGMDIYLGQKQIYNASSHCSNQLLLRRLHSVKASGLNGVLVKWGAPKGANEYKESMKSRFTKGYRSYFQRRPLEQEFLNYSARDVEDLIEVYQNMRVADQHGLAQLIGELYVDAVSQ